MQRFTEFAVLFTKPKDKALAELGLESNDEDYLDFATIDLNEVESFSKCPDLFGDKELMRLQLRSGDVWTIHYDYEQFKELISK